MRLNSYNKFKGGRKMEQLKVRRISFIVMLTFVCVIGGLMLIAPVQAQQCPSTLEKIKERGKFIAGVRFDYPPIGSIDSQGKNIGFGPDIARAFAEKLGVKVEFVQETSQNRIALLSNGTIDADVGSTTPSKKREEVVDFCLVYFWAPGIMLVRKGEPKNPEAYATPPKIVADTQGSINHDIFLSKWPKAKVVTFQEFPDCVLALVNKKVDAVIMNKFVAMDFLKKQKGLEIGGIFMEDPMAIMVRENDSKWRKWINWTLQELWVEGRFQKIWQENFGEPPTNFHLWSEKMLMPGIGAYK
jgi:polar amino acid transport system substrate-binding protein